MYQLINHSTNQPINKLIGKITTAVNRNKDQISKIKKNINKKINIMKKINKKIKNKSERRKFLSSYRVAGHFHYSVVTCINSL